MFDNQSTGKSYAINGPTVDYGDRCEKMPEPQESLGLRVEATYYTVGRIEDRVEQLKRLLFGESDPQCEKESGLSSIDDAINGLKYRTANIEHELDRLIYKLTGSN